MSTECFGLLFEPDGMHGLRMRASYRIALPFQAGKRELFHLERNGASGEKTMEISCLMDGCSRDGRRPQISGRFVWKTRAHRLGCVFLTLSLGGVATAQSAPLVLEREGRVISLEPYAANIVR